jgi:hypothetical protein
MADPVQKFAVPIDMMGLAILHLATPTPPDGAATRASSEAAADTARAAAIAAILAEKGVAGGFASLDVEGKLPLGQLPAIAINDTFVVASEAAMVVLTAQRGDVAIRTDLNKSFILATDDPTQVGNWRELLSTGYVLSVDGLTGVVRLSHAATLGDGAATSFTVNHNLGTTDVHVSVLDTTDALADVMCRVTRPNANQVLIEVGGVAPAAGSLRAVVSR